MNRTRSLTCWLAGAASLIGVVSLAPVTHPLPAAQARELLQVTVPVTPTKTSARCTTRS